MSKLRELIDICDGSETPPPEFDLLRHWLLANCGEIADLIDAARNALPATCSNPSVYGPLDVALAKLEETK